MKLNDFYLNKEIKMSFKLKSMKFIQTNETQRVLKYHI